MRWKVGVLSRFIRYTEYIGDLETTVFKGQVSTEAWSSAIVRVGDINPDNVLIHHSINETYNWLKRTPGNIKIYYHNLKFDGEFWIWFLMHDLDFKCGLYKYPDGTVEWKKDHELFSKELKCLISSKGQFYTITFRIGRKYVQLVDSYKLLPFSVDDIAEAFNTKYKKLTMEYAGRRYAGCEIKDDEVPYIQNDVLVMSEAVHVMHKDGHNKITIGSCCFAEFKSTFKGGSKVFSTYFPNQYKIELNLEEYGSKNVGEYVLKSYGGGWCYLVDGASAKLFTIGVTLDVTSLYPSRMHSSSGCRYPIGEPTFFNGEIPKRATVNNRYFFVRLRCRFQIKPGYLPFIHIRNNPLYMARENLKTSDVFDRETGKYSRYYKLGDKVYDTVVEMTMTCTDYYLFNEHYDIFDLEILDGCYYETKIGLFDQYIDKYIEIKNNSEGVDRTEAKLFLNNLYGKLAMSTNSSFKYPYVDETGVHYLVQKENNKKPGYIPCGSAITSYCREFTIRHAQKNYRQDLTGFIYADTDSCHCACSLDELEGFEVHPNKLNTWKLESEWDQGFFLRQKTYIERIVKDDGTREYNVTCAGMSKRAKNAFIKSIKGDYTVEHDFEKDFLFDGEGNPVKRDIYSFQPGLFIKGGNLKPKHIPGGVLLVDTDFSLR